MVCTVLCFFAKVGEASAERRLVYIDFLCKCHLRRSRNTGDIVLTSNF